MQPLGSSDSSSRHQGWGQRPRRRTIQYSGPVASGYWRHGVLDAPPSRGMTTSLRSGNAWIQITPVWIVSFDRAELPSPIPLLQTLFPLNGVFGIIELLKVEVRRGNLLVIIPSYHRHWSMPFPRAHDGPRSGFGPEEKSEQSLLMSADRFCNEHQFATCHLSWLPTHRYANQSFIPNHP